MVGVMVASCQPSFDDLGQHLSTVEFCVVDLETTGGGPDDAITIGAVRVVGGEVVGIPDPRESGRHIPPLISV